MAGGWTTLGALRPGALFETRGGRRAVRTGRDALLRHEACCACVGLADAVTLFLPGDTPVREIPLDYLLACVHDLRLESSGYQLGWRDGMTRAAEAMQAHADDLRGRAEAAPPGSAPGQTYTWAAVVARGLAADLHALAELGPAPAGTARPGPR
jgi:hypothetical protein